jgi:ribosomal protein L40E
VKQTELESLAGPEKYPLREIAVIICSRCKARSQLSLLVSRGRDFENLICPKCLCRIPVSRANHLALVPPDRGKVVGSFAILLTPKNRTTNHNTMRKDNE